MLYVHTQKPHVAEQMECTYMGILMSEENDIRRVVGVFAADDITELAFLIQDHSVEPVSHVWNPETHTIEDTDCLSLAECMECTLDDLN